MRIHKIYPYGFKIKEKDLRNIHTRLYSQIKPIGDTTIEKYKITYIDGAEIDIPDIDSILKEENGEEKTIQALTINLTGNKNNNEIAHIYLIFAADPNASIQSDIWSDDTTWCINTQSTVKDALKDVRKKLTLSMHFHKNKSILLAIYPFSVFYLLFNTLIERYITKYIISSNYIFFWGEVVNVIEKKTKLRNTIINIVAVGILIALIVSIIGGIIANYITIKILQWH